MFVIIYCVIEAFHSFARMYSSFIQSSIESSGPKESLIAMLLSSTYLTIIITGCGPAEQRSTNGSLADQRKDGLGASLWTLLLEMGT